MNGGFFTKHKPTEGLLLYKFQGAFIKVKEGRNVSQHTTLINQLALDIEDQEHPFMESIHYDRCDIIQYGHVHCMNELYKNNFKSMKILCVALASTSNLHLLENSWEMLEQQVCSAKFNL